MTASTSGMRTGPFSTWKDFPCSACAFRSNITAQIHMAGRACTSRRRQFEKSSFRPVNSIARPPTTNASGLKIGRFVLRRRTRSSTIVSPPRRTADTNARSPSASLSLLAAGFGTVLERSRDLVAPASSDPDEPRADRVAKTDSVHWTLAVVALSILAVATVSARLHGTSVTPAMVFVAIGVLAGPLALDEIHVSSGSESVKVLAEATLTLVLFADASRIRLRELRKELGVPVRLLGIGLPLTIAAGALVASLLFSDFSLSAALVLAVLLAPTDAALGQAVVTEPRLPSRIRQSLNVESGLNDGICVPILLIVLAA